MSRKLYEDRYWQILLHYKKSFFGMKSFVDDPAFFLAKTGKTDPKAEMEATIRALFAPDQTNKYHAVCRFLGRYSWLKEQLDIDASKLPHSSCEEFDRVIGDIKPVSAILVFPTYFMNSPASMFGHTMINIETETQSPLLFPSIHYSAITDETNGLVFALKGLFGYYKGYYSIQPYYQELQDYSDISQRDIWEYPLNLNKEEVMRLLKHLWEIRDIYSEYYFFDENCSFNLLFLIESAVPSLHLIEKFPRWTLPIDMIRTVEREHLVEDVKYRPSKASKIQHKISLIPTGHQKLALDMIQGRTEPQSVAELAMDNGEKIKILDLSIEYVQYLYAKKEMTLENYQPMILKLLSARSRLGQKETDDAVPVPTAPDEGHESARLGIGVGVHDGGAFTELTVRPVFCDMTDSEYSRRDGNQIQFFNTKLRYYEEDRKFVLENLSFVDIMSVSARDRFFKPYSWKVNTGFFRRSFTDGEDSTLYRLNTGGGMAVYHPIPGLSYLFAEAELDLGGKLEQGYAVGGGMSAGILKRFNENWKLHVQARQLFFAVEEEYHQSEVSLSQHVSMSRNTALRLDLSWTKTGEHAYTEAGVFGYFYF